MSLLVTALAAVGGAVAAVVSQKVIAFVSKQVASVKTDVGAVVAKVETEVKK